MTETDKQGATPKVTIEGDVSIIGRYGIKLNESAIQEAAETGVKHEKASKNVHVVFTENPAAIAIVRGMNAITRNKIDGAATFVLGNHAMTLVCPSVAFTEKQIRKMQGEESKTAQMTDDGARAFILEDILIHELCYIDVATPRMGKDIGANIRTAALGGLFLLTPSIINYIQEHQNGKHDAKTIETIKETVLKGVGIAFALSLLDSIAKTFDYNTQIESKVKESIFLMRRTPLTQPLSGEWYEKDNAIDYADQFGPKGEGIDSLVPEPAPTNTEPAMPEGVETAESLGIHTERIITKKGRSIYVSAPTSENEDDLIQGRIALAQTLFVGDNRCDVAVIDTSLTNAHFLTTAAHVEQVRMVPLTQDVLPYSNDAYAFFSFMPESIKNLPIEERIARYLAACSYHYLYRAEAEKESQLQVREFLTAFVKTLGVSTEQAKVIDGLVRKYVVENKNQCDQDFDTIESLTRHSHESVITSVIADALVGDPSISTFIYCNQKDQESIMRLFQTTDAVNKY